MELRDRNAQLGLWAVVFVLVDVAVVTVLVMATHGWYPLLADSFCGSLGDFTDRPVPAICLSFSAYWRQSAIYPPYALTGALLGGGIATVVAFPAELRAMVSS